MIFKVYARRTDEAEASLRDEFSHAGSAETLATRIARGSGDDGAMSVWVERDDGEITWAAGEKAAEIESREAKA